MIWKLISGAAWTSLRAADVENVLNRFVGEEGASLEFGLWIRFRLRDGRHDDRAARNRQLDGRPAIFGLLRPAMR